MSKLIDLTGKLFGKWLVLSRTTNSNAGKVRWLCRCSCGNERPVSSKGLKKGTSTQCKSCAGLKRLHDLKGKVFGRLTVIERAKSSASGETRWACECECGNKPVVQASNLQSSHSTQCRSCQVADKNRTHGLRYHPLYSVLCGIKARCYQKSYNKYHRYGGRGISVCDRWKESFINFYDDMIDGYRKDLQIDRRDNDGNYEPNNCRWITSQENSQNSSMAKLNAAQVSIIKYHIFRGARIRFLAKIYNMSITQIKDIRSEKCWSNIPAADPMKFFRDRFNSEQTV